MPVGDPKCGYMRRVTTIRASGEKARLNHSAEHHPLWRPDLDKPKGEPSTTIRSLASIVVLSACVTRTVCAVVRRNVAYITLRFGFQYESLYDVRHVIGPHELCI